MLDTVQNGHTGLLGRSTRDLIQNVCTLLERPDRALAMGEAGYQRILQKHDFAVVAPKWVDLCDHLANGTLPRGLRWPVNLFAHLKFLRVANRPFQKSIGRFIPWPSLQEVQAAARRALPR